MAESWRVICLEQAEEIHFTIQWSPWGSMDKWVINRIVPSEAGVFQLWVKRGRGVVLLHTETTYYGGLRNSLRETIDELAPSGRRLRDLIGKRETWFRFSTLASQKHLKVLEEWFRHPEKRNSMDSREVLIQEIETMKKFPLPPPDIQVSERNKMSIAEFGPRMPEQR